MEDNFATRLGEAGRATEAALDRFLSPSAAPGETERPQRLMNAMRYAVLGRGKRLRPFVLIEAARLFGGGSESAVAAAAALECVHAYSLTHDDLPAMDDDDLRRGQPTVHKAFDEATAILAGDALLMLGFDILADRGDLIRLLARAAGPGGMAGGQMLDLAAKDYPPPSAEDVIRIQGMKTGALFRFAGEAGAILGGASPEESARLAAYGAGLGLAFQIADDLAEATAAAKIAGRKTRKDAARRKATVVGFRGMAGARALLSQTVEETVGTLAPFGEGAAILAEAAQFVGTRKRWTLLRLDDG